MAHGERRPHPEAEPRLRGACPVIELLTQVEDAATVRAWFRGMNPDLGDTAPALLIGQEPLRVLQAARAFLAHG